MEIRRATAGDAVALAELQSQHHSPTELSLSTASRDEFATHLRTWMQAQGDNMVSIVADADGVLIGCAWLVIFDRVPTPGEFRRLSADIQSVYVEPGHRGHGIGERLVRALCVAADELGIPRVTVHSSGRAVPIYERSGFHHSGVLLLRIGRASGLGRTIGK